MPPPRTPLKVLRIIARLNVGGPARHVTLVNRGLAELGHDALLVYGNTEPDEASLEHAAKEWSLATIKVPQLGRRLHPWDDLRAFIRLVGVMFRFHPDVVHTHTAKAGTLGRLAAALYNVTRQRKRRCLVVHTFHGHVFEGYFRPSVSMLVQSIERLLAAISDRIVTISEQQRADIVNRFHIGRPSQVVVIRLGLELECLLRLEPKAADLRSAWGIPAKAIVVGYVGRFAPIKDLSTLVRAFDSARRRHDDLWLVMVGDGSDRAMLEALVDSLGIARYVRFPGWLEDLPRLYATFDICALSSRNEGTPVAVIEAMAAGKAVAATAVGGVVDLVRSGETGLLVPAGQIEALTDALVRLATSPDDRARMGAAARRMVSGRFSASALVAELDRLYREALDHRRT